MFGISSKFIFLLPALVLIHSDSDAQTKLDKATFAGGCFWCMEHPFEKLEGVLDVVSGYTGGHEKTLHMRRFQVDRPVMWRLSR